MPTILECSGVQGHSIKNSVAQRSLLFKGSTKPVPPEALLAKQSDRTEVTEQGNIPAVSERQVIQDK